MQGCDPAELLRLVNREVADADRADVALLIEVVHSPGSPFDGKERVGPVDLIDISGRGL